MNEIAASLIIIYFTEALYILKNPYKDSQINDLAKFMMDLESVEADVFTLFDKILEIG